MDIKHIQFTCRMYWANAKGLLNIGAEGIILLASIASLFVLVYQFGFQQTSETIHHLYLSRIYILLGFFIGITLRYIVRFNEIIQEKLLYLDIGIYFLLFAVLSAKVFFKDIIEQSLPYLAFLSKPLFVYMLMLLLSVIHLSRQTFTLMQTRIKPSLLFLLSFIFVILIGAGLLMLPNATTRPIHFVDALFTATTSVCVTGLTTGNHFHPYRACDHYDPDTDRRDRRDDFHEFLCAFLYGTFFFYQQTDAERYAERGADRRIVPGDTEYPVRHVLY